MPRIGINIGISAGAGTRQQAPLPLSTWDLSYIDATAQTGYHGGPSAGTIPSQGAGASAAVVGTPLFDDSAVGGRRTVFTNNGPNGNAGSNYLTINSLSSHFTFGQKWTVMMRVRAANGATHAFQLFNAGSSSSATNNFFQVQISTLGFVQIITATTGGGTVTRTGSIQTEFDEHTIAITLSTSGTLKVYIDGVQDTLDNSAMDTNAITANQFAVLAFLTTAASPTSTGYIQNIAIASTDLSLSQIAQQDAQWRANDFTYPLAARPQFAWTGDSLTEGGAGTGLGGFRVGFIQWLIDNGLSWNFVGFRQFGQLPLRHEFAQGGTNLDFIATNFNSNIGSYRPRLIWFLGGTNDQSTETTATALGKYDTDWASMDATAFAANPASQFIVTPILPFDPINAPTPAANEPNFNAGLPSRWAAYDAANPTRQTIRADVKSWIGGVFNASLYVDTTHPNDAGNALIVTQMINVLGPTMISLSPTVNTLSCTIGFPVASASLPYNSAVTIVGASSRWPCTVNVFKTISGVRTLLGAATVTGRTWSFSWTPVSGDAGAVTLSAVVTNTLDSTTATSPSVAVTVVAPAVTPLTIWGSAVQTWGRADLGLTTTKLTDQSGNGKDWTGTCAVNASDSTLNNLKTGSTDGNTQNLSNTFNLPTPSSGTPTCYLLVLKHPSFGGSFSYSFRAQSSATMVVGPISVSQLFASNGTNENFNTTYNSWQLIRADFSGQTSDIQQSGSNTQHTGNAGTSAPGTGTRIGSPSSSQVVDFFEVIVLNKIPTSGELTSYYAYLDALTASSVAHP